MSVLQIKIKQLNMNTKNILKIYLIQLLISVVLIQVVLCDYVDKDGRWFPGNSTQHARRLMADSTILQAIASNLTPKSNCFPFYIGSGGTITWTPNYFAIYKGLPPAIIKPGDHIQFDLSFPNDIIQTVDIALGHTATDGGTTVDANGFTTIVSSGSPPVPGDTISENYELSYAITNGYNFPGGGLMIRISNPSSAFASDSSCSNAALAGAADSSDASGLFVARIIHADANGNGDSSNFAIPSFKIVGNRQQQGACLTRICSSPTQCCRYTPPGQTTPVEQCYSSSYSCISDQANAANTCLCHNPDGCCNLVCFGSNYHCVADNYPLASRPYSLCTSTNRACNKVCYDPAHYFCNAQGKIVRI
jgi:hypothetical protein